MRLGRGEAKEVAPEVNCDPPTWTRVLERVPACRVDARCQRSPVQKRPRHVVADRDGGWIEAKHDRVVQELDGDESDRGVEWRGLFVEKIGHGRRS